MHRVWDSEVIPLLSMFLFKKNYNKNIFLKKLESHGRGISSLKSQLGLWSERAEEGHLGQPHGLFHTHLHTRLEGNWVQCFPGQSSSSA